MNYWLRALPATHAVNTTKHSTALKHLKSLFRAVSIAGLMGLAVLAPISPSHAGSASGQVLHYYVHWENSTNTTNSYLLFRVTNIALDACAAATNEFVVRLDTNMGKAVYQTVMLAKATGANVIVSGSGNCPAFTREGVGYIKLE